MPVCCKPAFYNAFRPLRWLPAYSWEYPKGRLGEGWYLNVTRLVYLWGPVSPDDCVDIPQSLNPVRLVWSESEAPARITSSSDESYQANDGGPSQGILEPKRKPEWVSQEGSFGQHTRLFYKCRFIYLNLPISRTCSQTVIENISRICLSCMVYTKYGISITNIKLTKKIS